MLNHRQREHLKINENWSNKWDAVYLILFFDKKAFKKLKNGVSTTEHDGIDTKITVKTENKTISVFNYKNEDKNLTPFFRLLHQIKVQAVQIAREQNDED
jgi:hypothetical protein